MKKISFIAIAFIVVLGFQSTLLAQGDCLDDCRQAPSGFAPTDPDTAALNPTNDTNSFDPYATILADTFGSSGQSSSDTCAGDNGPTNCGFLAQAGSIDYKELGYGLQAATGVGATGAILNTYYGGLGTSTLGTLGPIGASPEFNTGIMEGFLGNPESGTPMWVSLKGIDLEGNSLGNAGYVDINYKELPPGLGDAFNSGGEGGIVAIGSAILSAVLSGAAVTAMVLSNPISTGIDDNRLTYTNNASSMNPSTGMSTAFNGYDFHSSLAPSTAPTLSPSDLAGH